MQLSHWDHSIAAKPKFMRCQCPIARTAEVSCLTRPRCRHAFCPSLCHPVSFVCAAEKLEACEASLSHGGRMGRFSMPSDKRSKDDQQLTKITRDSSSMAVEQIKGMTSQV